MFDFDKLRECYQTMKQMPPDQRGPFTTTFVMTAIAFTTYYIVAGVAVILLGRRLIQASFAAFKEARRERA
jgi:hypothetical protein